MASKKITLDISGSNVIEIDDDSGAITLKTKSGAKISIGSDGITLDNGQGAKIVLSGPKVDVNSGALTVI